jgi:hypothetical protein
MSLPPLLGMSGEQCVASPAVSLDKHGQTWTNMDSMAAFHSCSVVGACQASVMSGVPGAAAGRDLGG